MLGRSAPERGGQELTSLAQPGDAGLLRTHLRTAAEGPRRRGSLELRYQHRTGAVVWGATRIPWCATARGGRAPSPSTSRT